MMPNSQPPPSSSSSLRTVSESSVDVVSAPSAAATSSSATVSTRPLRSAVGALRRLVGMESQSNNPMNRPVSRAELAKKKIENIYRSISQERTQSMERRADLDQRLSAMKISDDEKRKLRAEHFSQEMAYLRARRRPMSEADFQVISIIGRGAFGEVILVRHKSSSEYYAMKKLRKADMLRKEHVNHAWSERHVLVAADHPFVCNLCFAFQNNDFLYLVMEFLAGGDLMTLLMARETLTEDETRFYAAEMVVAIDTIHKLGFIHRDVKPDNLLIDESGHIKLSDFGLCKSFNVDVDALPVANGQAGGSNSTGATGDAGESRSTLTNLTMSERAAAWKKNARKQAFSTVGTPDYISVEVLMKRGYNKECDYWSLGVVLYEMLVGYPPFYADDALRTCRKILNWRETLKFPQEANVSWSAKNLIQSLLCEPDLRLGAKRGIDDFKEHPFFKGIDWDNLLNTKPPFVPELRGPTDVRYFEHYQPLPNRGGNAGDSRLTYLREPAVEEFIGFTFKRYNPNEAASSRKSLSSSMGNLFSNPDGKDDG